MITRTLLVILIAFLLPGCPETGVEINKDMRDAIRLKSRIFVPVQGTEPGLKAYFKEREDYERVHVIVQFHKVPSLEERKILKEKMGLQLLDPVPERAFYASVPRNIETAYALVKEKHIRWIGRIENKDRVKPRLITKGFPEHAIRQKSQVEMIVEFFGDVSAKHQEQILNKHGVKILNRIVPVNGWHILFAEAKVMDLTAEDEVKWIVEIPGPPEDDNDGVRSDTGVNADPILPPEVYNLTGTGTTVAQWESYHATTDHNDYMARITIGDPPVQVWERGYFHDESVTVNAQFDNGENLYRDMDDSGTVSAGDFRLSPVATYAAGSTVAPMDTDIGTAVVAFIQYIGLAIPYEGYTENVTNNGTYDDGEGIYLDNDINGYVSNGDTRLTPVDTYAAGSAVVGTPADTDVGRSIFFLKNAPHYHASHVAGTVLGDGSRSLTEGGTADQWKGVAPAASLRSYRAGSSIGAMEQAEYVDAAANGVSISTNSWGNWTRGHCHQTVDSNDCYDIGSQFYDAVISGRQTDGSPSGLARQILIFGSAGNQGRSDRHTDNVIANGLFDAGETIYQDDDDNGIVSVGDDLLRGPAQPNGTPLINFTVNERHDETVSTTGVYNTNEGIYFDADNSQSVTAGDTRTAVPAGSPYADGSVVSAGDTDDGVFLRQFRLWGTVRIPNSAKNTIEVASLESDTVSMSVFSSKGPTHDGRYKPDVAAPGCETLNDGGVTSTWPGNGYGTICGTSMSTPAAAASAALLDEWYRTTCDAAGPTPDILKALLMHTADELNNIPNVGAAYDGPDYAYGYGRVRVKEAVDLLPNYLKATAVGIGSTPYNMTIGVMETLKVTLVWNDPPWVGSSAPSAITGLLQNDLDLLLIAPDGTKYTPWVADAIDPAIPASRSIIAAADPIPLDAEDHRNTVEQVVVQNAMAGTWTIQVTASGMNLPPQDYILVSEALPTNATDCTVNPTADVWVKDNPTDDGTVPSSGAMYLGQDIWNRNMPDGHIDDTQQNPEHGQPNYLYARVRNSSATETIRANSVDAWIGTLAIGLVWPDAFTHVGRFNIPNLTPGEVRTVGPIEWYPPAEGHYCMYTRVQSPQDPITFAESTSVWTNAINSNNIAYRNMSIVDVASSKSISFLVRNVMNEEKDVEIVIDIPEELQAIGEVQMALSPELDKLWPIENRQVPGLIRLKNKYQVIKDHDIPESQKPVFPRVIPNAKIDMEKLQNYQMIEKINPIYQVDARNTVIKGIRMKPKQAELMTLTFGSKQTIKAEYHVHVTQKVKGETVGGILFVVRTGYAKK